MVRNPDMQRLFDKFADLFNPRISKFQHQARFGINKVIVLFKFVRPLELGAVIPELVLGNKAAIQQQLDRVIQSGTADPVLVILHANIECLDIEMPVGVIDFL